LTVGQAAAGKIFKSLSLLRITCPATNGCDFKIEPIRIGCFKPAYRGNVNNNNNNNNKNTNNSGLHIATPINILGRLQVGKPKTDVVFSQVYPPHIVNK
jgi:hypothetical protein